MNTTPNTIEDTHLAECETCGASHVFATGGDAEEWAADHRDLGHLVDVGSL